MSLLVKLKNRASGQPVIADDDDNEFDNIINCLAGVSLNKSIRVRSNDDNFAVARFDQLGTNDILELYQSGAEVARFEVNGKFRSLVPNGTAPMQFDSNTMCPGLNAEYLGGVGASGYQPIDAELTALAAIATNGFLSRTGAGTAAA